MWCTERIWKKYQIQRGLLLWCLYFWGSLNTKNSVPPSVDTHFSWLSTALASRKKNLGSFVDQVRCIICMRIKEWGGEWMLHWWWFPHSLCSHCRSVWSAGSWRCPRCTWGTRSQECASQTGSQECCPHDQRERESERRLKTWTRTLLRFLMSGFTFVRSVPCIPQSTSASPRDRWSQKMQQELQTEWSVVAPWCDKHVECPIKHCGKIEKRLLSWILKQVKLLHRSLVLKDL